jgi:1,4-dihydroxy-2-naphthoate octaprenyltransferase
MGFLAAAILVANNVRDMATDAAAGKRTLAVVLGRSRNEQLFAASLAAAFASVTAAVLLGDAPAGTLLALLAIPLTVPLAATLRARQGRALIPVLEGTARLQLFVAVLYATGAIVFG